MLRAPRTRVIRITNVRANANALGVAGGNSAPTPIIMTVSATGATSVPINNPQQTVAFVLKGLQFSVFNVANTSVLTAPIVGLQCVWLPAPGRIATLRFTELFATAFKKRTAASSLTNPAAITDQNGPGVIYNTESGFVNRAWVGNTSTRGALADAGLAEFGTRLKATFNNVPAGVLLYVDQCASEFGSPAARVCGGRALSASGVATPDGARATSSETGGFSSVSTTSDTGIPAGVVPVTITAGTGSVIWEVSESDAQTLTTFSFQLYGTFTANPGATGGGSPALGTASINGSFAPISTVGIAATGPIPRFADTSTSTNVFSIVICQTNLLFPFVTNQVGFDTGLAIAATATDPFGTAPQGGTCTLNWYGANAPAATVTPTVASGTVYATLTSSAAPNFQGYMIAVCRFQYGHGFAFVSDLGATRLAMGYLALVIPDPARSAIVPVSGSPSGEQLAQ